MSSGPLDLAYVSNDEAHGGFQKSSNNEKGEWQVKGRLKRDSKLEDTE